MKTFSFIQFLSLNYNLKYWRKQIIFYQFNSNQPTLKIKIVVIFRKYNKNKLIMKITPSDPFSNIYNRTIPDDKSLLTFLTLIPGIFNEFIHFT
jgi:hypothetical protein